VTFSALGAVSDPVAVRSGGVVPQATWLAGPWTNADAPIPALLPLHMSV
jgi:hypothetical protein